ncbi:uncharacterized protein LOC122511959 [Leptopilina heterotoma]|uniref:uncharacterized protein LOC122511959 n=1 Tax=Leptopilina heterotoma TaxID=63436 RepID=UPI001CA8C1A6|nr:uncharacterized protein LOC122511959 [Leptopilina heterotoma]
METENKYSSVGIDNKIYCQLENFSILDDLVLEKIVSNDIEKGKKELNSYQFPLNLRRGHLLKSKVNFISSPSDSLLSKRNLNIKTSQHDNGISSLQKLKNYYFKQIVLLKLCVGEMPINLNTTTMSAICSETEETIQFKFNYIEKKSTKCIKKFISCMHCEKYKYCNYECKNNVRMLNNSRFNFYKMSKKCLM